MPDIGRKEVDGKIRHMALLATLLGCQCIDGFKAMLPAAMNFEVTPVEIKEITCQAVAYLGIGRVESRFLAAQGGCEPQLTSNAAANMRNGNDKLFLIKIISHCLPFIGYPRSLNELTCVNKAAENNHK